jgi:hypothetical protein
MRAVQSWLGGCHVRPEEVCVGNAMNHPSAVLSLLEACQERVK